MSAKLDNALFRLRRILPLKRRQDECSDQVKMLHRQILRAFVTRGRMPTRQEMSRHVDDPDAAIKALSDGAMLVMDKDGTTVGAYPFTMDAREHRVQVNGQQVFAMCALDALAISPMFNMRAHIASRCRLTGTPVNIWQSGEVIENPDEAGDVQLGIHWGAEADGVSCADSLCLEMMYLKNEDVARKWLMGDAGNREIFTLSEAMAFSSRFFLPLMSD